MKSIGIVVIAVLPVLAQTGNPISAERIREHDRFLSSDLLDGRAVGARGGNLATEYLATQFALAGAKPAGENGSYFQKVPLVGIEPSAESQLSATAAGNTVSFQWLNDFVGVSEQQKPETQFEGEAENRRDRPERDVALVPIETHSEDIAAIEGAAANDA